MRPIDADAMLAKLADSSETWAKNLQAIRNWWPHAVGIKDNIVSLIKKAPTIEAAPVVHGRWVIQRYYGGMRKGMVARVVCSECFTPNEETNYCPNCGAKMDGGEKDV